MSSPLADLGRTAFSFLLHHGFRPVPSGCDEFRYESANVVLQLTWAVDSGELDLSIGLKSQPSDVPTMFSFTDIVRMKDVDVPERAMPFQVFDRNRLAPFIEQLAEHAQIHAQEALTGDRLFFRRLGVFRSTEANAYTKKINVQRIKEEADKAWRERLFDQVVHLYGSIESDLSRSEATRLDYARRHRPE